MFEVCAKWRGEAIEPLPPAAVVRRADPLVADRAAFRSTSSTTIARASFRCSTGDPFDRPLVAQAIERDLSIVTPDQRSGRLSGRSRLVATPRFGGRAISAAPRRPSSAQPSCALRYIVTTAAPPRPRLCCSDLRVLHLTLVRLPAHLPVHPRALRETGRA